LELEYDAAQIEIGSRTYANLGNRDTPVRGVLLEETKTVDCWLRDLTQPELDPTNPPSPNFTLITLPVSWRRRPMACLSCRSKAWMTSISLETGLLPTDFWNRRWFFENGREAGDFLRPIPTKVVGADCGRGKVPVKRSAGQQLARVICPRTDIALCWNEGT
jgi:hypothetical protein